MPQHTTPETKSVRTLRVGEQVRHVLSDILARGDVHDETLDKHPVSVTEVRMSPDLRHATVFVKPLLGANEAAVIKALRTNTAYLSAKWQAGCNRNMPPSLNSSPMKALMRVGISINCSAHPR